jgi:hypothetical protein
MKTLVILLSLFSLQQTSFAQNWSPFVLGETYNYVDQNSSFSYPGTVVPPSGCNGPYAYAPIYSGIGATTFSSNELQVWIDSITIANGDSIFHFNKRIYRCDTCSSPAILVNQGLNFGIINETFIKNSSNQYVFNYKGDSLVINPYLSLNDSIISDSSRLIYSILVQEDYNILPNYTNYPAGLDSSKVFNFCINGNVLYQLRLTKNLGIYSFTDFSTGASDIEQVGLESKEMGVLQLTVKRIFDYEVGDEFSYQFVDWYIGEIFHSLHTIRILTAGIVSNDSTIYQAERTVWWTTNCCPASTGTYVDTFDLVITPTHNYGQYNVYYSMTEFERLNLRDNEFSDYYLNAGSGLPDIILLPKNFLRDGSNEYKLIAYSYGLEALFPWHSNITHPNFYVDSFSNIYDIQDSYQVQELYAKGIGLVQRNETSFEGWTCLSLLGYRKGNTTVGTILSRGLLLEQQAIEKEKNFSINVYPNPSSKILNINVDTKINNDLLQIDVLDLKGVVLMSKEVFYQDNYQLSIGDLSQGVYLLQLKNNKGALLGIKKFVVNN